MKAIWCSTHARVFLNICSFALICLGLLGCRDTPPGPTGEDLAISISPDSATAGDPAVTVTITTTAGQFFANDIVVVTGNGINLNPQPTLVNGQTLTVVLPATALAQPGELVFQVGNKAGSFSNNAIFTVKPHPVPTITTISPNSVQAGSAAFALTVNGTNFVQGSTVQLNGAAATTTFVSAMQVTAQVPASAVAQAGTIPVTVINAAGGTPSNAVNLTVTAPVVPSITAINPNSVVAGSGAFGLGVHGANFQQGSTVELNGTAVATTFVSTTQLTAQVPANDVAQAGSIAVTVVNTPGGTPSNTVTLAVTAPAGPTLNTVSPSPLQAGTLTNLFVTGTNFANGAVIEIDGTPLTTSFTDSSNLFAVLPGSLIPNPGTAQITVVNPGGTASNAVPVPIVVPSGGGSNDIAIKGNYLLHYEVTGAHGFEAGNLAATSDGFGLLDPSALFRGSAGGVVNGAALKIGTTTYDVASASNQTKVFFAAPSTTDATFTAIDGYLNAGNGSVPGFVSTARAGADVGGFAELVPRNLAGITQASLAGTWSGILQGQANGQPFGFLASTTFDATGNGSNGFAVVGVSFATNGVQTSTATINLGAYDSAKGCATVTIQINTLTSPPMPANSLNSSGVACAIDNNHLAFVNLDSPGTNVPRFAGEFTKVTAVPSNASTFSGPTVLVLPIQTALSPGLVPPGVQTVQLLFDGAGGITSGVMDQNNGIASTLSVMGTYTFDPNHAGFGTIDLTTTGGTPLNTHFAFLAKAPNTAVVLAGTAANSTVNFGGGFLTPQTGQPCSANTFTFNDIPFAALDNGAGEAAAGHLLFGSGPSAVFGFADAVQGGTVLFNSPLQGSLAVANAATCRFTGSLTGYPGTTSAVPVTGFLTGSGSFVLEFQQQAWIFNMSPLQ